MPFKDADDPKLPDNVKDLPAEKRAGWVKAWNSAHAACMADDGENCEARAYAIANGALEDMGQPDGRFAELIGKRLSRKGRELLAAAKQAIDEFFQYADERETAGEDEEEGDVEEMSTAPFLMIELTAASLVVGKPFDGVVFGSFVDMYGREVKLDAKDKAAYIANTKRAIEATRGESGELAGLPIDAKNHDKGDAAGWIVDVIDGGGDLIRFLANWTEIGVELIGKGIRRFFSPTINTTHKVILGGSLTNWIASTDKTGVVKLRPVELAQGVHTFQVNQPAGDSPAVNLSKGAKTMNLNDLSPEDKQSLLAQAQAEFVAKLAPAGNDGGETYEQRLERLRKDLNLSAFAELTDVDAVRAALQKNMEEVLTAELARVDEYANRRLAQMMADRRKSLHIAEFAAKVTGGTNERPYGLPVGREEIETFLSGLNDQQRSAAESIIRRAWENDPVPFSELGHGKEVHGTAELAAPYKKLLNDWVGTGGNVAEFFALNADVLGGMSQYNLAEFKGGK